MVLFLFFAFFPFCLSVMFMTMRAFYIVDLLAFFFFCP